MPTQPDDDELLLIRQSGVVLRAGLLSLSAGTGSYRVKETMARIAAALGIDRHHAQVTLTEITSTSHRGRSFRTEVAEVATVGVNASRLAALEALSVEVERRPRPVPVDVVADALDRIEGQPPRFGVLLGGLWAGLACAAFCFLIGGGPYEVAGALLGGWAGQLVRRLLLGRHFNHFGATIVAAAAACFIFLGFVESLRLIDEPVAAHQAGYVAAVLFLIPGFPLVTAGLDLARLDLSAGVARLTYAVLIALSAALAVWAVAIAFDLTPATLPGPVLSLPVLIPLQAAASFAGVAGFALMFNGTWRMALAAGLIGMVANVLRLELVRLEVPPQAAAALAALLVGLLTAAAGPMLRVPRITLSVPAVLVMVPGVLLYRGVYAVSQGDAAAAVGTFAQAALVTMALPIGLALARMLTDRRWAFAR
ncbi:MAG: threonine/serine exporter family protein [Nakamurella multipartita]